MITERLWRLIKSYINDAIDAALDARGYQAKDAEPGDDWENATNNTSSNKKAKTTSTKSMNATSNINKNHIAATKAHNNKSSKTTTMPSFMAIWSCPMGLLLRR
ncbi:MAG: hypothetical protein HC912_09130 [Saprospiraceae bacterium]|nr:hypothetical protein [Saprospiraceae bacterium]